MCFYCICTKSPKPNLKETTDSALSVSSSTSLCYLFTVWPNTLARMVEVTVLNAQINPLPQQALVRHSGWNLILDISVMTFFTCNWEECDWRSGDNWVVSCCESCRPCKHKNVNVTMKALSAAGCWCHLAPLGSAGLCGSVFSGFWKSLTRLLVLSSSLFFFSCCWGRVVEWDAFHYSSLSPHRAIFDARQIFSPC